MHGVTCAHHSMEMNKYVYAFSCTVLVAFIFRKINKYCVIAYTVEG